MSKDFTKRDKKHFIPLFPRLCLPGSSSSKKFHFSRRSSSRLYFYYAHSPPAALAERRTLSMTRGRTGFLEFNIQLPARAGLSR
jgi:hypothetical protein